MKRVLIISPHFAPINAPDLHRVRMGLPFFRELGWEPTVLAVAPEFIEGGLRDPLLEESYPKDIRILRCGGLTPSSTRWAGLGNLWLRCGASLRRLGDQVLEREHFDLAFYSTTQFAFFSLGPRWLRRARLPYVLDYQDPWRNDYYRRTGTRPPGGRIKFFLSQLEARLKEPPALRKTCGVVSVSANYASLLRSCHPWFDASKVCVLPFGCSENDFALAQQHPPGRPLVDFDDGLVHHVYVGRCGDDMRLAIRILLQAFGLFLKSDPSAAARLRFHFIGTDYAPPPLGREWVLPIARELGLQDFVSEHTRRVPYFEALHYLVRAQAVVALGSDDSRYSPSKLHPCLMAGRPLLLICAENGPAEALARGIKGPLIQPFRPGSDPSLLAAELCARWFNQAAWLDTPQHDGNALASFSAHTSTTTLCRYFDQALSSAQEATT